ncbi:hypothetical protein GDO81_002540 [Engystomops pustulosus]|uniref:Uncharacterized protein n=1 Tax=Engystomops pustulosus TaxID=76066 RepID=A0AAV7DL14_ENGPU|nr:hypothetical protein GDO81_002540 [Engystomops pustulosus]KAG8598243.1 hypothetical protein GDO81_002540 [Engystomops pustulosus]
MSRKRRKNKNRKSSGSEEFEHLPFFCHCQRKFSNPPPDKDFKDSQKEQGNDHSNPCTFPSETQTQSQNCDNFVKVTWHDTPTMSQHDKEELHHNTEQTEDNEGLTVTSKGFHLNLEINKGLAQNSKTCVIITNGKSLKKSRSYHDRQHLQSQHNANHTWDFMQDSGNFTDMSASENKNCDKPLIKLKIIGEGIEVKYKAISQNVRVYIKSDEVEQKNHDVFGSGFTQANDYCSTGGSCSSYPVSDFSFYEGKEFCSSYRYPEWCADVPPPPAEFADETFVNTEDEALLLGDSIKESYYTSPSSSSWSELETEPRQSKNDMYTAEQSKKHQVQNLRHWKKYTKEPVKPNKANFTKIPFMSNKELKLNPSSYYHSKKSDRPLDAKIMRRKTFPQIYYDPFDTCRHTGQSFLEVGEKAQENEPHVSPSDFGSPLVSSSFLNSRRHSKDNDYYGTPPAHPKANLCCAQEGITHLLSNVSGQGESDDHLLDAGNRQLDEDEDLDDMLTNAEERLDFTESGFDEDMLDSDNHTDVQDISELKSKGFLIQVTPPSRSTSKEFILGKNSNSRVPIECLQQPDVSQSNAPETENGNKKRRGSVVTVVTGDLDQRVLIQSDFEAPASRMQRELSKEFKFCLLQRDSVLTPVTDVEEPDSENKIDSSFEDQTPLICKDISSQTSEPFDPFLSVEHQTNTPDEPCIQEAAVDPEQEESNNTSPRNSSDSAIPGTSFESMSFQIPSLLKSDSEDNYSKNTEKSEECLEKTETPIKKTKKKDTKPETFNKHLKLPKELILKESRSCESPQEEGSDRWAKKRKQFKETRNCNSAGGSSITSNITEESGNSEETRSVDLASRSENKDKGLYTESFHSASWIFQGDDCSPNNSPRCLSKRPRSVAIRERTVRIAKGTGDYPWGFRIQFSKPILVTEVDTNGAAEEAGLQVGDIVMAVNGTDVTSIPHSEAATLARQGPDVLTLVVGSDISRFPTTPRPTCRGYLHKRTHSGLLKGWRKRWFVLKHDGSLHYYKHKKDEGKCRPLEVTKLEGSEIGIDTTLGKPFVFRCVPQSGNRIYYFCATSNQEMKRWLEAMDKAVHPLNQNHVWVDVTMHNISLPPLAIKNPECLGLLHQLDRNKDTWVEHYCILKDGCLYFYTSIRSNSALGGIYLQGYTVSEQTLNSRRCIIELRPPSEEFKTFYLSAGNAAENKRWITALKISISKWLPLHQAIQDFMSRPPEETRM